MSNSGTGKRVMLWGGTLLVLGGLVYGLAWASSRQGGEPATPSSTVTPPAITKEDHIKGNPLATAVLIEYSDMQCPACRAYYPVVKRVAEELGTKVQVVYRHYPLERIHKNARLAATAAEAAGKQGTFWEMHDMLFDNQEKWSESSDAKKLISGYAATLKLSLEQFEKDLSDDAIKKKIDSDLDGGTAAGVQGTPTFYLNGKKLESTPPNYEQFKKQIEESLLRT